MTDNLRNETEGKEKTKRYVKTEEDKAFLASLNKESETGTFKIPDGHPDKGKEVEFIFEFPIVESEEQALRALAAMGSNLIETANEELKAQSRASAYQAETAPYRPDTMDPAKLRERMINDLVRTAKAKGMTVEKATVIVDGILGGS